MIVCKSCGAKNSDGRDFCRVCGDIFPKETITDGEETVETLPPDIEENTADVQVSVDDRDFFGAKNIEYDVPISPLSRWLAFILCAFWGILGIHRFYAQKIITGVLYVFTLGFLGIGVIVDLIFIAMGKFTDKSGLYLKK